MGKISSLEPRDNNEKDNNETEESTSRGIDVLASKSPSMPSSSNSSDKALVIFSDTRSQ